MLADEVNLAILRYPAVASPKLDGVRAIVREGIVYSRNNKPIPNRMVQEVFGRWEGFDGELIAGSAVAPDCFRRTMSAVMSRDSTEDVDFHVFDSVESPSDPWFVRFDRISQYLTEPRVILVPHINVKDEAHLLETEQRWIDGGFEGVMLRDRYAPYKNGRSTAREGYLLKMKRFVDIEVQVIGMEERLHNANEAKTDELGYTSRSSHKANMVPMGTLGALQVRDNKGRTFNVGTGFTDDERAYIWNNRLVYMGKWAKVKFLNVGVKELPRHPVFLGWRM
jgi:DNA ligase-1